jgi:hypothetical protein
MRIPMHVPRREEQIYWLVALAVMSAMFSPCAKLMLKAARVEPPAIIEMPFRVLAMLAIRIKWSGWYTVKICMQEDEWRSGKWRCTEHATTS